MRVITRPIIWLATILHYVWGVSLILSNDSIERTTGLAFFSTFARLAGLLFLASAALATIALFQEATGRPVSLWTFWLLVPQQALLTVSASAAAYYVTQHHYASGTQLPSLFIFV